MQCLTQLTTGYEVSNPQPTDYTTCTAILVSPTELQNEIFNLTPAQGSQIGAAVILVWAVAFTFRAAISSLNSQNESENSND